MRPKDIADTILLILSWASVVTGAAMFDWRAGLIVFGLTVGTAAISSINKGSKP